MIEIAGKRLITLNTFAKNFGLHVRTVQLWARQHDMPVIRIGNQMLLDSTISRTGCPDIKQSSK